VIGLIFRGSGQLTAKIPPSERSSDVPQAAVAQRQEISEPMPPSSDALRQLLAEQLPILRIVARGLSRDPNEIEDLVQDAYERALRSIDKIDLGGNPRGWMVTILHNLHIDRCRRRARMKPHVPYDEVPIASPEAAEPPAWSSITAEDVRRAAAQLSDELRTTYTLFALEGRSYQEVSEALGIPKATVGTRISRARARLKELLGAQLAARGGTP
jgi:RNA polymerase sigma-70 factor (ECF subfamily)